MGSKMMIGLFALALSVGCQRTEADKSPSPGESTGSGVTGNKDHGGTVSTAGPTGNRGTSGIGGGPGGPNDPNTGTGAGASGGAPVPGANMGTTGGDITNKPSGENLAGGKDAGASGTPGASMGKTGTGTQAGGSGEK